MRYNWNDSNKKNKQKNHFIFPSPSLRCLIVGSSGCGKTTLLFKLLLEKYIDYNHIYLYSKSMYQPEYKLLKNSFEKGYNQSEISELFENGKGNIDEFLSQLPMRRNAKVKVDYFEDGTSIPDPSEVNSKNKNLFIFDDVATEKKQTPADNFYTRGRHNNCNSIYLSQNYYLLPRQTIRTNANVLILFALPTIDMRNIYTDIISLDMSFDEFQRFCFEVYEEPYNFIVIIKDKHPLEGKYFKKFRYLYIPEKYFKDWNGKHDLVFPSNSKILPRLK